MGSVTDCADFNAEADAEVLRKAMKGLGTDEKAIINVITRRSNRQRQQLISTYKQCYGKDLVADLKSELSGNFEDVVLAMFSKPREYDAACLRNAIKGVGTDETTLIEILTTRSNEEIKEINQIYKSKYGCSLESAIKGDTSGYFKRLLVSLNNGGRDLGSHVDATKATEDAEKLHSAGEKKWGTDEETFNMIMATRSFPQLRATFDAYHRIANKRISDSIKSEFSGDIEDGLLAIVGAAENMAAFFAERLYKSMKGAGTKDDQLIRIVVSRSEIDMEEIKKLFHVMYGKTLASFIKDDTSGDYRRVLMGLVGQ